MDKQIYDTVVAFYSDVRERSTDEVYEEYVSKCIEDGVAARNKTVVIREICKATGCAVKEVRKKYFA